MTQQHFATPSTPNADMRPCSPPLAFWTFLVCKCPDLGKRECWWRAPPLLLREIIFLGNYRDAVHKCQWSVEIIRCRDQDLLPFLLRICDPKGRFFHAKFPPTFSTPPPINWVHPADIHIAASDGHIRHGVKLFFLRVVWMTLMGFFNMRQKRLLFGDPNICKIDQKLIP